MIGMPGSSTIDERSRSHSSRAFVDFSSDRTISSSFL
jgi:hypothetical protein